MITICTLFWTANDKSKSFSTMYNEAWVEKLYRGFERNLTQPFRFICFVDREREFREPIEQELIESIPADYGSCIEPYKLNVPMILVGLDTVITGNIDHFADYCFTETTIALPRAVYLDNTVCNGVALVPAGKRTVYDNWNGENDMEWMRRQDYVVLDDLFPGHAVSYKGHAKENGIGDARVVFFHGKDKPHEINEPWLKEHWL